MRVKWETKSLFKLQVYFKLLDSCGASFRQSWNIGRQEQMTAE